MVDNALINLEKLSSSLRVVDEQGQRRGAQRSGGTEAAALRATDDRDGPAHAAFM